MISPQENTPATTQKQEGGRDSNLSPSRLPVGFFAALRVPDFALFHCVQKDPLIKRSAAVTLSAAKGYSSATTGFVSVPSPSVSTVTVSPGRRKTCGSR